MVLARLGAALVDLLLAVFTVPAAQGAIASPSQTNDASKVGRVAQPQAMITNQILSNATFCSETHQADVQTQV